MNIFTNRFIIKYHKSFNNYLNINLMSYGIFSIIRYILMFCDTDDVFVGMMFIVKMMCMFNSFVVVLFSLILLPMMIYGLIKGYSYD